MRNPKFKLNIRLLLSPIRSWQHERTILHRGALRNVAIDGEFTTRMFNAMTLKQLVGSRVQVHINPSAPDQEAIGYDIYE
jgi:hypothetical protein